MSALAGTFRSYFGAVCVPILDKADGTISNVTHDWANATSALGGGLAITILRLQIRNYRVDIAKQKLAEMAVANNCQFLFMLDDDVLCPPDTLLKMIKLWKSDPKYKIISGVYWSKSNPPLPLIFRGNLEGSYWDWKTTDLITADGAGAGCLFIDCEVLKKMPKPWFSCGYYFEDPRSEYDLKKWELSDNIGSELLKGAGADKKFIDKTTKELGELGAKVVTAQSGQMDPELLKNKHADAATTEDLYFFKKAKELTGNELWVDCSIQCLHQDKRTGQTWGIQPDMPQARPRYTGKNKVGDKVVLDIGCGKSNYWISSGNPIRIDSDPSTNPDILCDARQIPLDDCFADEVYASHILEHFSFHETRAVLREWIRLLKVGGKLGIIVPNLKWASKRILDGPANQEEAERAMFFYYSAQVGDIKESYTDAHRSGFTMQSIQQLLKEIGGLTDVKAYTSEGNFGNWDDENMLGKDDMGYNVVVFATKAKHEAAISLKMPVKVQEDAKSGVGKTQFIDGCVIATGHKANKKGLCMHCGVPVPKKKGLVKKATSFIVDGVKNISKKK